MAGVYVCDATRSVYVVDQSQGEIGEFDFHGNLKKTMGTPLPKSSLSTDPIMGKAYIIDDQKKKRCVFDLDQEKSLNLAKVIEEEGPLGIFGNMTRDAPFDPNTFQWPVGISGDGEGSLFVADVWNNRIVVLNEEGKCVRSIGERGKGNGAFELPCGVVWDRKSERLFVADGGM